MSDTTSLQERLVGHGDIKEIARITGFNVSYVRKVLNKGRKNDLVFDIAADLITMRQKVREKYASYHKEHKEVRRFTDISRIETILLDLQFRPVRRSFDAACHQLEKLTHDSRVGDTLTGLAQQFRQYESQLLQSLDWLYAQRILIQAEPAPLDLYALLNTSVDALASYTTRHKVTITATPRDVPRPMADPFLTGLLIRSLLFQLIRITAAGGHIAFSIPDSHPESPALQIDCQPCLLTPHNFELLNSTDLLRHTNPRAESPETAAAAARHIMSLQRGSISFTMHPDKKGTILIHFNAAPLIQ
ncbi:hypothetical protein AB9P05_09730 [Roseivirga sp. BDSF3-8]|uniref:hypothetical protein n=1 Tax=Roseivirga sp. BDSF3-8 TaxID=3241598 RepID=UPI003531D86D